MGQILTNCPIKIEHSITQISIVENNSAKSKYFGIIRFEDSRTGWEKCVDANGWIEILGNRTVLSIVYLADAHNLIEIEL